jgi:hypothetical protein
MKKHIQSTIDEALEKVAALKRDKLKMKKKRTSTQENNQKN